ncbi:MAG: hypothetical protein WC976_05980 [Caldisericia bacterium]
MAKKRFKDSEGVLHKPCDACGGTGNVDAAAGFQLDCAECEGSGWVPVEQKHKPKKRSKRGNANDKKS